ncbi:MAG: rod shape-determining protein MreC [Thermostichales cyanobacterium SZTDM-1c_bins_54]
MFGIRRWWSQHALTLILSGLVLGGAWGIRSTRGAWLAEGFSWLNRLWTPQPDPTLLYAATQELQVQLQELQRQNQELRQLLNVPSPLGSQPVVATVIARQASHWWQQFTVNRGQKDNIMPGDVVAAPGGLMGRVEMVTPNTSRVLLISDPSSRVGVVASRSREMGILRGLGSQEGIVEFFSKDPEVQVGDAVLTSGLSSFYPAGMMVGVIRGVNLDASPAPQATVELSAPLGMVEWVLIYRYDPGRT